uniref:Uncharacterized protein n=1 Tax=Ascaris lumbricoides TaxID=6252 RepID=A0A0M3IBQ1_ASCLU
MVVAAIIVEPDAHRTLPGANNAISVTAQDIADANRRDDLLQKSIYYTHNQWPPSIQDRCLRQLFNRHDTLSTIDGCLLSQTASSFPMPFSRKSFINFTKDTQESGE